MKQRHKFANIFFSVLAVGGLGIWNDKVFSFAQFLLCACASGLALGGWIDSYANNQDQ